MAIKFAVHGDSINAYLHSGSGKAPFQFSLDNSGVYPVSASDAGAIGGTAIDFVNSTKVTGLIYPAGVNSTRTGNISVLARIAPNYTGSPATATGLFGLAGAAIYGTTPALGLQLYHLANGNLSIALHGTQGTVILNGTSLGAWSPTAGQYYDIVVTWNGPDAVNSVLIYIDGTLFSTQTSPTQRWTATNSNHSSIVLGQVWNLSNPTAKFKLNEFVIWDIVIDPTSGGLNLSGSARAAFVSTSGLTLDPTNSTDPGIANVANGTGYIINGVSLTGNVVAPSVGNVKTAITYGSLSALTGTYDGSDRWTDPAIANVRSGTAYKANSTSNNRTGTLDLPSVANVKNAVTFDGAAQTGTLVSTDPGQSNVRNATSYTIESVAKTGTQVDTDPGIANVRSGTAYQIHSASLTGTAAIPTAANVRSGTATDATTGSLAVPTPAQVLSGISTDNTTGTLNSTDPGEANVLSGTAYIINSVAKTGTRNIVQVSLAQATIVAQGDPVTASTVLDVTQGDTAVFNFLAVSGELSEEFDLTGATFSTTIAGTEGPLVLNNAHHAAAADQTTNTGEFTLTLSAAETTLLRLGKRDIVVKVTQGSDVKSFRGIGLINVETSYPLN